MIFIAMPLGTTSKQAEAITMGDHEVFTGTDQQVIADWAAQRALTTKTDYQVFKLTEVLYYKGHK